jgi:phosphatidylserine/phosphatidylglycerophosphate/cardiolipin synthase-like enzyme
VRLSVLVWNEPISWKSWKLCMMKIINVFSVVVALQMSFAQAQNFDSKDTKAVADNVLYLRKTLKHAPAHEVNKIAKYLAYIKLTPDMKNYKMDVSRLLGSSLQFILCDGLENTACLEAVPAISPSASMRVDVVASLGTPVKAGKKLEIDYYFTKGWFDNYVKKQKPFVIPEKTVAMQLADEIKNENVKSVWMALYGIDDIQGSMSSVYQAVEEKVAQDVPVQAVVDVSDAPMPNGMLRDYDLVKKGDKYEVINMPGVIDYSYIVPQNRANWAFGAPLWTADFLRDAAAQTQLMKPNAAKAYVANEVLKLDENFVGNGKAVINDSVWMTVNKNALTSDQTVTRMSYQYNATMDFMRLLNRNKNTNEEAMAHIEYPYAGIMHNKFVVFENDKKEKSVWTGTANISRTCMGSEENANMSILIKNDLISQAFLSEFNEMFSPREQDSTRPETLMTGSFHNKKRPNTQRNFIFDDGTEVRVHFSPTDDAEHKVILPMLYSARKGDLLRISMFGSGGYELVRALQSAVARGVNIKIAVDRLSGAGNGSWVKSPNGNLFDKNPFSASPAGSVEVRVSDWPGLNHHKSATLTRRFKNGKFRAETIIIGSQNWSASGNDLNDENLVTITNKKKALNIMLDYNREFDEKIWVASRKVDRHSIKSLPVVEVSEEAN